MEVKINLNRRAIFDGLVVIQLVLLVVYGVQLQMISKKVSDGSGSAIAAAPVPSAAGTADSAPTPSAGAKVRLADATDYVLGNKNAPISFIEYSDFECPFCKRFQPSVSKLMQEYKDKVKFVYRHYPLSFHANAQKEAEAAECVGSLGGAGKYYEFHDKVFERTTGNGTGFALENLPKLAAELGINQKSFETCLNSGKFASKVQAHMDEGNTFGVSGTPSSFIIVDKTGVQYQVEGAQPYESLKQAVDRALSS